MTINRPVPWAIYSDEGRKLEFLTMAASADDVWQAFNAYTLGVGTRETYRDQGYECTRVSVKRFTP